MFTLFRYGLIPIVLFCVVVVAASIDTYSSNVVQKSTWRQTVVTVVESQDPGDALAAFSGTQNTFPDPHGTLSYVVDGKPYTWQGRGRDIGVTAMNPGDEIKVYYDPENPQEISTLVLLGASTGNMILAAALAFLGLYIWFFWLRGFLGRSAPPDDFDGDAMSFADGAPDQIERSRFASRVRRTPMTDSKPAARSVGQGRGTFGKR
jgi:Protein of unknown function (DUF3592)